MDDGGRPNVKVARVIERYGLDGLGEELERHWTGRGVETRSLRDLAGHVNRAILRAALESAGVSLLEGELENTYRLLTDGDVSEGMRTQTRRSLASEGVDVETVTTDFVSHTAVHTYLTDYRGVEKPGPSDERMIERGEQTVGRMRSRVEAVTESTLTNLRNTDRVSLGDFDVLVNVRVLCADCGADYEVDELLARGGCNCE